MNATKEASVCGLRAEHLFTMKMDSSLSKSSSVNTSGASSNRSSGVGTMGAPSSLGFREAAHFANIMVEFEDREAFDEHSSLSQML